MDKQPSSVVVETRVSIQTLATLHKYFEERGLPIGNRSEIIRTALDIYSNLLTTKDPTFIFTGVHDAYNYLLSKGIHFGQRGSKSHKSVIQALQAESLEMMDNIDNININKDDFNKAVDILNAVSEERTKQDND